MGDPRRVGRAVMSAGVIIGVIIAVLVVGTLLCCYVDDYSNNARGMNLGPSTEEGGLVYMSEGDAAKVQANRAAYAERARKAGIAPPAGV